jgi:hypothetical protein
MKKLLLILLLLRIIGPVGFATYIYLQHDGESTDVSLTRDAENSTTNR